MRLTAEDDPESSIQSHSELSTGLEGLSGGSLGGIRPIHSDIIADPYAPGAQSHSTVSNDEAYPSAKNSHAKGLSNGSANGSATNGSLSPRIELYADSVVRRPMAIARVNPPGTTLYPESATNREEFVRLVIQTMKDIGYLETAAVLELESGYSYETSHVTAFRRSVLEGDWNTAEKGLTVLGVRDADSLRAARFLINQQKYLEQLEAGRSTDALLTLRQEIAPMDIEPSRLHHLSSLMMSSSPQELQRRATWDGANGNSRHKLLNQLQQFVPSSTMVPPRRLDTLLEQAREQQIDSCNYHMGIQGMNLYQDHVCSRKQFPTVTTHILEGHTDEVWQVQWNHRGNKLASSGRDMTVILWSITRTTDGADLDCKLERVLHGHTFFMNAIAWSPDDSLLLSSAEHEIKLWNVETGACLKTMFEHSHAVNGLCWFSDGRGFITGGMDRKIVHWNTMGEMTLVWPPLDIRILELAITPDGRKLVAIGLLAHPISTPNEGTTSRLAQATLLQASAGVHPPSFSGSTNGNSTDMERRIVVYDLETRQEIWSQAVWGELQSVKISDDSRFALINHRQGDVMLWDLEEGRLSQRYFGRPKGSFVVRNCFGGANSSFVLSGSEDGHIYVWHRRTGTLFEVLAGHEPGGVNSVDWCPQENAIFASCGDDGTIRIWGPEPEPIFEPLVESTNGHTSNFSNIETENGKNTGTSKPGEKHFTSSPSGSRETPPG